MDCVRKPLWPGRRSYSYSPEARFTRSIFRLIKRISQIWEYSTLRCDFVCVCQDDKKRSERRGCFRFKRRGMLSHWCEILGEILHICTCLDSECERRDKCKKFGKKLSQRPVWDSALLISALIAHPTHKFSSPQHRRISTELSQSCHHVFPKLS